MLRATSSSTGQNAFCWARLRTGDWGSWTNRRRSCGASQRGRHRGILNRLVKVIAVLLKCLADWTSLRSHFSWCVVDHVKAVELLHFAITKFFHVRKCVCTLTVYFWSNSIWQYVAIDNRLNSFRYVIAADSSHVERGVALGSVLYYINKC